MVEAARKRRVRKSPSKSHTAHKTSSSSTHKKKRAPTAWMVLLKKVAKDNPGMKFGDVMKKASKIYRK
jgi:hypothetical protein